MADYLCQVEDIESPGARGFGDGTADSLFAVRCGDQVSVYRNRCPHAGAPLNWMPHRFLTRDKKHIICSAHGALFNLGNGTCVAGPCVE